MARKKIEPITGIGTDPTSQLTVQKSRPLFALWQSDLSLAEFKILDTYLSRINSHNPEKRAVVFEKGELEKLLGIKKINNNELDKRLRHLMGNVVRVDDPMKTKSYRLVSLFEEAVAEQDDNGLWEVRLECTQKAMKYFFNVENLGYLRYKLRCVTSLSSRYTYILFVYLEANRFRKSWEVDLEELKKILSCENEETLKEYKYFNRDVLKRVQKEMNEKTECRFTYEPIKKGRSVVAIRFTLATIPEIEPIDENQMTIFDNTPDDHISFLQSACCPSGTQVPEFTRAEMTQLFEILAVTPNYKFPTNVPTGNYQFQQYHYLSYQYANMNRQDAKNKIKNRFAYLLKVLKTEAEL